MWIEWREVKMIVEIEVVKLVVRRSVTPVRLPSLFVACSEGA